MKYSEICTAFEGRGELKLLSVNHEQFPDILAVANLELFLHCPKFLKLSRDKLRSVDATK